MNKIKTISRLTILKNRKRILANPLPFHRECFQQYGDTFKIDLGKKSTWIFTRDTNSIKHILQKNQKNYNKSPLQTEDLGKYIGKGLLTSNGEFWRVHRRMIQPAFHKKKLESLMSIMHQSIKRELEELTPNEAQDVLPLMGDLAFQVVAQSLFSADNLRDKIQNLKAITIRIQEMLVKELRLPYLKWWFQLKGEIKNHLALSDDASKILNEIIQERVDFGREKDDLLDMLLSARYEDGTAMSRNQLLDEVMVLFTAGHETTANALSFTLFLLAKHTEIQEKVFQEVTVIDFDPGDIMEKLGQLPYTKQCIEETLRLYPPLFILDRISMDSDKVDGQQYDKGTVWLMSFFELHRHDDFWKKPDEFMPERFDPVNKKDFSDYYFPFGAGPRMCIGNNFAMYEMMMTVAEILKKYVLTTAVEDVEINPLLSLKPQEVVLKFIPR